MKHIVLVILFAILILPLKILSQEWNLLNNKFVYNYSITRSDSINIDVTVWIDSLFIDSGDTIFYLNRIAFNDGEYYYRNKSHFLQGKVKSSKNGTYQFSDPDQFTIKSKSNINDFWIFDSLKNIQAKVVKVEKCLTFNVTDSIKTILLSTDDTIKVSKNYGIIQFPRPNKAGYYYLKGIDNAGIGMTVPKINDFFNYSINDSFEVELFTSATSRNPRNHLEDWQHYRYKISKISENKDTIIVWREGAGYHYSCAPYFIGSVFKIKDSIVIDLKQYSYLNRFNNELLNTTSDFYNYVTLSYNQDFKELQKKSDLRRLDTISTNRLRYSYNPFGEHRTHTFINHIGLVYDYKRFVNNDLSYDNYQETLIACKKKNYSYGVFSDDSLFYKKEPYPDESNLFKVYPNPSTYKIYIRTLTLIVTYIKIYNLLGICVFNQSYNSLLIEINIENFQPGIYFVTSSSNNFNPIKFIKK